MAQAPPRRIVIASRESALALTQARYVQSQLAAAYPTTEIRILGLTTEGDRRLEVSLAKIGGKGLFVKELEQALASGRADIAVHSAKDLPAELAPGFVLAAVSAREDPRDAFVSNRHATLAAIPAGGRVGTSSLRRECQVRARFPRIVVEPLRGNVTTRLRKLDDGFYDGVILAAAGLRRLGHAQRITALLGLEESVPAPGQGALAVECRAERQDLVGLLAPVNDAATAQCVAAERAFSRALAGSCNVPLGAHAELSGGQLRLHGFVGAPDGSRIVSGKLEGRAGRPEEIGATLAERLRAQGAAAILAELERQAADESR